MRFRESFAVAEGCGAEENLETWGGLGAMARSGRPDPLPAVPGRGLSRAHTAPVRARQ
jgi:hypothetical protein